MPIVNCDEHHSSCTRGRWIRLSAIYLCFLILFYPTWLGATSITYFYDSLNRVTDVVYSDGSRETYIYDPSGNRLSRITRPRNEYHTLTIAGQYNSVAREPDLAVYSSSDVVLLSVTTPKGLLFVGWEGDANGNDNPLAVLMDSNKNITPIFARTASPEFNELLNFDNGLIPPGWNLVLNAGTNSQIANYRFQVGSQVNLQDTRARLEVEKSMPINATGIEVSYVGNLANIYDGMGSQIHLISTNGTDYFCSMNKAMYGVGTIEFIIRGSGPNLVHDILPGQFGTFTSTATFKDNQIRYTVVNQASNTITFDKTISVPGLNPHQLGKIWLTAFTTPGDVAWIDDVNIRFVFPQLSPLTRTGNQFQLLLNGVSGSNYLLQTSSDLTNWVTLSTNAVPGIGTVPIFDPKASEYPFRFYRVSPTNNLLLNNAPLPVTNLVASGLNEPSGLVIDGGIIYFADNSQTDGIIKKVATTGGNVSLLYKGTVFYDAGAYRGVSGLHELDPKCRTTERGF